MANSKILIVEDDSDVSFGLQVLLKAHHYDTAVAADALSALNEARMRQPDLIILDLGLPVANGFFFLERLKADPSLAAIPVVVVTARDAHENEERAHHAGARAYMQKPWNDDELLATITRLLSESKPAAVPAA